jgi:tripartite-type tricarboxylate transporter receptor subunit TctC
MSNRRNVLKAGAALAAAAVGPVGAQERYPARPVTIVVPFAAGGGGDAAMRFIADQVQKTKGATVVVENRPGGGATIGSSQVARSAPDGYTLGLVSTSPFTVTPYFQKVPYDPIKDFTFVAQFTVNTAPVYVAADSRFKTIQDLIEYGRANPGKLRWATAAPRGTNHIAMEAALRKLGVRATFVPFGGGAEAMAALLGGNIEFGTDFGPPFANRQIRLLAESGPVKIPGQPEVPTFGELGFPLILPIFLGIGGPAGLPADVVKWWEDTIRDLSRTPEFGAMMARYYSPVEFLDSAAFTQRIRTAYAETGKAVRELGMVSN